MAEVLVPLIFGQARPLAPVCAQATPSVHVSGPDKYNFLGFMVWKGLGALVWSLSTWWDRDEEPDQRSPHEARIQEGPHSQAKGQAENDLTHRGKIIMFSLPLLCVEVFLTNQASSGISWPLGDFCVRLGPRFTLLV